jgi:hypothetical protein
LLVSRQESKSSLKQVSAVLFARPTALQAAIGQERELEQIFAFYTSRKLPKADAKAMIIGGERH